MKSIAETNALDCQGKYFDRKQTNLAKKMDALMKRQDYNLDMYKKLMSTHHKLLLTSQSILQMLLTIGACTPVHASRCSDQRVACERDTVRLSHAIEDRQV
jgi:hypothetical protein